MDQSHQTFPRLEAKNQANIRAWAGGCLARPGAPDCVAGGDGAGAGAIMGRTPGAAHRVLPRTESDT